MFSAQTIIFVLIVLLLMGGLVIMGLRMKSGSNYSGYNNGYSGYNNTGYNNSGSIFGSLMGRSNQPSSLGSYQFRQPNGFFGGKGKKLLTTVPTYGLVGFLFTFSLVAWSYMTNN
jgi:hypothetical protein